MKLLIIFFKPQLDLQIPFDDRPLIEVIINQLLFKSGRDFYLGFELPELFPEISSDVFGFLCVSLAKSVILRMNPIQHF
jgi:hypothetical protein